MLHHDVIDLSEALKKLLDVLLASVIGDAPQIHSGLITRHPERRNSKFVFNSA